MKLSGGKADPKKVKEIITDRNKIMKIRRTATCGELTVKDVDRMVSLSGWVENYRDHGGVIFIDLFDRWGMTQVVFDPEVAGKEAHDAAGHLRSQYVVSVTGEVRQRPEGMANDRLETEILKFMLKELEILNKSKTLHLIFTIQTVLMRRQGLNTDILTSKETSFRNLLFLEAA